MGITNQTSGTNVHEIADGIFRINTPIPIPGAGSFSFNQYLVVDDEPLIFHTGPRKLFPLVREAVQSVVPVETLKYTPNAAARALAGSRSYLIGLFFDNPSPGYVSQVEFGAMSCCRNTGYHLLVEQLDGSDADVRRRVEAQPFLGKLEEAASNAPCRHGRADGEEGR